MSDEIKAAAERWKSYTGKSWLEIFDNPGCIEDAATLVNAYLSAEAAREAEQAERAKGITEEWLLSIGFNKVAVGLEITSQYHEVILVNDKLYLACLGQPFIRIGTPPTTTRGMMLDFLSSLKIPTKQQQNDTIVRKAETDTDVGEEAHDEISGGR